MIIIHTENGIITKIGTKNPRPTASDNSLRIKSRGGNCSPNINY